MKNIKIFSLFLLGILSLIHQSSTIPVAPLQLPHLAYISIPEEINTNRQISDKQQELIPNESSAHIGYARTFAGLGGLGFSGYSGSRNSGSTYGSSSLVGNLFNAGNAYRNYGWYGTSPGAGVYGSYGGRYNGGTLGYLNGAESRYAGGGGWRG